jgi:hypothetical protein
MKKFFTAVLFITGLAGALGSLWLMHQTYTVGRLYEHHSQSISDGRISEEIYDQESALAWREMAIHLSLLFGSSSLAIITISRMRGKTLRFVTKEPVNKSL